MEFLRLRPDCQVRAEVSSEHIRDLVDHIDAGLDYPPISVVEVTVAQSGEELGTYVVVDGFHRHAALLAWKATTALVEVVAEGSVDHARMLALGANAEPRGLRRTNADKRKAVELALVHPQASGWSNVKVADLCKVSHEMVRQIRAAATVPSAQPSMAELQRGLDETRARIERGMEELGKPLFTVDGLPAGTKVVVGVDVGNEPSRSTAVAWVQGPGTEGWIAAVRPWRRDVEKLELRTGGVVAWAWFLDETEAVASVGWCGERKVSR